MRHAITYPKSVTDAHECQGCRILCFGIYADHLRERSASRGRGEETEGNASCQHHQTRDKWTGSKVILSSSRENSRTRRRTSRILTVGRCVAGLAVREGRLRHHLWAARERVGDRVSEARYVRRNICRERRKPRYPARHLHPTLPFMECCRCLLTANEPTVLRISSRLRLPGRRLQRHRR